MKTITFRKSMVIFMICCGFVISNTAVSAGTTIHVDDDGLCDGNTPCYTTISDGINAASDGDTVYVYNGVYYENVVVNKTLNLIGEDRDSTIIDGGGSGDVVKVSADSVNVSGFRIKNSGPIVYYDAGLDLRSSNNIIVGNDIQDNNEHGIVIYYSSNNIVSDNNIIDNGYIGIYLIHSSGNTIQLSLIEGNKFGIYMSESANNIISGNNISSNSWDGSGVGILLQYGSKNNIITKNVIASNGYKGMFTQAPNVGADLPDSNYIYLNNFIENANGNAYDEFENFWDKGPQFGNYWEDHTCVDANQDGVCDTPYHIPGGTNYDGYPLVWPGQSELFIRGDYDDSGSLTMRDALELLLSLFQQPGAVLPHCEDAADYNDDGSIMVNDALTCLLWLFNQPRGVPPAPPGLSCGVDPTKDDLSCWYTHCPQKAAKQVATIPTAVEEAPNIVSVGNGYLAQEWLVVIPLMLINKMPLRGFQFTLNFDPVLLTAVRVDGGDGYDFFAPWIDNESGKVTVGVVPDLRMEKPFAPGQRVIAEIAFQAKADARLELSDVALYGSEAEVVDAQWVDGVVKGGVALPSEFALRQNHPNPFNPITQIKYTLPRECYVKLFIYNILGQKVATLVDGKQKAGYKTARWDAGSLSSGIYFYRLRAGDFVQTRKMVLLK